MQGTVGLNLRLPLFEAQAAKFFPLGLIDTQTLCEESIEAPKPLISSCVGAREERFICAEQMAEGRHHGFGYLLAVLCLAR